MISEKEIEKVQYSNSFQGAVEALCTLLHAFQVALVLDSTRPQKKRFSAQSFLNFALDLYLELIPHVRLDG